MNEAFFVPVIFLIFPFFWCFICYLISRFGGWHELAEKFEDNRQHEGQKFYMKSGGLSSGWPPASYNNMLNATVTASGFQLKVFPLFRVGHPPLFLPYARISECRAITRFFSRSVEIQVAQIDHKIYLMGNLGQSILIEWHKYHKRPMPQTS
jgi:hypothetical protein